MGVDRSRSLALDLGAALLVLALSVGIYARTASYGFLDWNDNTLIEQNPFIIYPPHFQHAVDVFVPGRAPGPFLPLRNVSYILDRQVLGTDPVWHHRVNVALYALDGLLLLWLLRKLLPQWAAVTGAVLWVAHPVNAETVSWLSERSELLAGGFLFGTVLAYVSGARRRAERKPGGWALLLLSALLALCAVSSHPVAVCIAPILLAWEVGRKLDWKGAVLRLAPQAMVGAWAAWSTLHIPDRPFVCTMATWAPAAVQKSRMATSLAAVWLDALHLAVPLRLSALYDVPTTWGSPRAWAGLAALLATLISTVWLARRKAVDLVWMAFLVAPLIPVSGIWRLSGDQRDHFLFFPAVGFAALFGIFLHRVVRSRRWGAVLATAMTLAFGLLSFQRTGIWKSDLLLWEDVVAKNPDVPSARNNLGAAYMNAGQVDKALEHYYAANRLLPTLDVARFNIAATELRRGHCDAAEKYSEEFSQQHPEMPTGWILLGQVRSCEARTQPEQAAMMEKMKTAADAFQHGCDVAVDADATLQVQDKASACNQAAATLGLAGDDDGALADWGKCMHVPGVGTSALHNCILGQAQYYLGEKPPLADEALKILHGLESSGDAQVFRLLSEAYYDRQEFQRASEYMQQGVSNERPGTPPQTRQHDIELQKKAEGVPVPQNEFR